MTPPPSPIGYLSSKAYATDFDTWAQKNMKNYSRRAFAKWAAIKSPNFLTLIISGKRPFQQGWIQDFSKAAKLSNAERFYLTKLANFEQEKEPKAKKELQESLKKTLLSSKIVSLKDKDLYLISSPDIWAIYIALNIPVKTNNRGDQAKQIKKMMIKNFDMAFIRQTLKNFYRLGLVNKENGTLTPKYKFISTNNEYSKIENVNFHTQALNEASTMLSNLNNEQRSYGSLTILLDKNEVGEIRKDIQSFGESLLSKYSEKNRDLNKENLVRVNMQLYLLSKEGDENEK